jgi:hypothetical protein
MQSASANAKCDKLGSASALFASEHERQCHRQARADWIFDLSLRINIAATAFSFIFKYPKTENRGMQKFLCILGISYFKYVASLKFSLKKNLFN